MKLDTFEQMESIVEESDLVLIGLGQEWIVTYDEMMDVLNKNNKAMAKIMELAMKEDRYASLLKIVEWYFYCISDLIPERLLGAYQSLYELVNQKNYFIVSLSVDSYLSRFGFKDERFVNPCGSYSHMQCERNCNTELQESSDLLKNIGSLLQEMSDDNDRMGQEDVVRLADELLEEIDGLKCEKCHERIVFNTLDAVKYNENGYLEKWQIYMKWLQGTVNKKTCIIEAGAGMELPSVIRWPFEKTVFYNQKAKMIRIHQKFFQVNEETKDRAYSREQNSVAFFCRK